MRFAVVRWGAIGVGVVLLSVTAAAAGNRSLLDLDLRDLSEVEVTSVSRKPQKLSETPAAVYVITGDEIRRSGATTLAEALRLAPGVEVARINASTWAVTIRGGNDRFSNKLLVLVDGRTVYTPLFSGVYWDSQDLPLENVERIEVIRGPGASSWGANAVNGVINVITKSAAATQGWTVEGLAGTEERGQGFVRYGGTIGPAAWVRGYVRYAARDRGNDAMGVEADDEWEDLRGGVRADGEVGAAQKWSVQTEVYRGGAEIAYADATRRVLGAEDVLGLPVIRDRVRTRGGWVLGTWTHVSPSLSELTVRTYLDRTVRVEPQLTETRDTWDLDLKYRFSFGNIHDVQWGVGFRWTGDRIDESDVISFGSSRETDRLWSGFAQDELSLAGDRIRVLMGAKVERNEYTGLEFQPTVRAIGRLGPGAAVWAAWSRAVRTPSRAEADGRILSGFVPPGAAAGFGGAPNPIPVHMVLEGTDEFDREVLWAHEGGIRFLWGRKLSVDLAGFLHRYEDLRTFEPRVAPDGTVVLTADNKARGRSVGFEASVDWFATDWWRIYAAYTWMVLDLRLKGGSRDVFTENEEGRSPRHRVSVRSSMDLGRGWELDLWGRYVGGLEQDGVDAYTELDIRLGRRLGRGWRVDLVGQNLLEPSHLEFIPGKAIQTIPTEVQRGAYVRITWQTP
ncbi:MAG: TonB-dependent receptor [Deltaproteobacteria bacterium]|nr:TonB-dependent receptor [Deltaproteobacteria bacterium]